MSSSNFARCSGVRISADLVLHLLDRKAGELDLAAVPGELRGGAPHDRPILARCSSVRSSWLAKLRMSCGPELLDLARWRAHAERGPSSRGSPSRWRRPT
jgi:hypothetical protein